MWPFLLLDIQRTASNLQFILATGDHDTRLNFYLGGRAGPVTDLAQRYLSHAVAGRRAGTAAGRYGPAAGCDGPAAGRDGPANEQASRASQVASSGLGGRTRALRRLYNKVVGQVIDTKVDNESRRCLKIMIMLVEIVKMFRVSLESLYYRYRCKNANYYKSGLFRFLFNPPPLVWIRHMGFCSSDYFRVHCYKSPGQSLNF